MLHGQNNIKMFLNRFSKNTQIPNFK